MVRATLIPISVTATLLSSAAFAQSSPSDAAARCASISDSTARLACYDRAARGAPIPTTRTPPPARSTTPPPVTSTPKAPPAATTPPAKPAPPVRTAAGPTKSGSWLILSERRGDGGENLFLLTHATGLRPNAEKPALTINCENGKLTLYVRWQREAGAKLHKVTYTIDGGTPKVMAMAHSKDTYSTGLWHPRGAANFAKRLAGRDRLTISFNAADGTPMAAIFSVSGLDQVMGRLSAACKM